MQGVKVLGYARLCPSRVGKGLTGRGMRRWAGATERARALWIGGEEGRMVRRLGRALIAVGLTVIGLLLIASITPQGRVAVRTAAGPRGRSNGAISTADPTGAAPEASAVGHT